MSEHAGVEFSQDEVDRLVADLVARSSVNPSLSRASGDSERRIAEWVAERLVSAGFDVVLREPETDRISVLASLRRGYGGPTLALNGHLDTVPAGAMDRPFEPLLRGYRLFGRGAYDMKGGVAACIAAAEAIARAGAPFHGTLQVAAVADEEYASLGTQDLLTLGAPDAVIVTEPTGLVPCSAHRGFAWVEVETRGRAAHGSMPELGRDANRMMGRLLTRVDRMAESVAAGPSHPLAGAGSLHVGRLEGGSAWSIYADRCRMGVERRTLPGESAEAFLKEVEAMIEHEKAADGTFEAEARIVMDRPPFESRPDSELRRAVLATGLTEGEGREQGVAFWTDAAFYQAAGADTVILGPAGEGAHADEEWVDLQSVQRLVRILIGTSLTYLSS